ncbi:MAG: leucine-rich repeat domain-containing protein [Ruminococcus flavefaciens]|nr:leucine-rich repeat domain-containing protein [Ruminococcus flavefaciens]MCM1229424.1 leucine-rich repeat domain-containing protein [Ruminococcus flavefaciens]
MADNKTTIGNIPGSMDDIRAMRAEIAELRSEVDILKRYLFFSRYMDEYHIANMCGIFKDMQYGVFEIPYGIEEIDSVFAKTDVVRVTVPTSVKKIGYCAFERCYHLESINIPDSVEEIDVGAFEECYELKEIFVPDSVKSIGREAFRHCRNLVISVPGNCVIGSRAFEDCKEVIYR